MGELPEGISPLVPAELTANAVGDSGDELSAQAQLRAQLQCKRLWRVLPLWHVPLKLVHQRDVSHVDVQLRNTDRKYTQMFFTNLAACSFDSRLCRTVLFKEGTQFFPQSKKNRGSFWQDYKDLCKKHRLGVQETEGICRCSKHNRKLVVVVWPADLADLLMQSAVEAAVVAVKHSL